MLYALIVFLGAGVGGVLRYGVNLAAMRFLGDSFPFGTLAVNVIGSFAMGVLAASFFARLGPFVAPEWRLFLMTGLLGGFTTFSAFSLDTVYLWERDAFGMAAIYVGSSLALSIAALAAGLWLVRGLAG